VTRVRPALALQVPALAVLLLAGSARAQSAPQVQVQVESDTVGVGDAVVVEMSATSGDTMPTDAQLGASTGFAVRGQNASPSQTHISINGNRTDRYTLTVDWTLQANKVGTFSVGPPSVALGGMRFSGRAVTVHVVPAGQAPPRRQAPQASPFPFQFQFSPFDPWRNMMQPPQQDVAPAQPSQVTTDPKLALDAPRGQAYFLHATVDKTSAVVGEPVIFSVYEYIDAGAANVEVDDEDVHDAPVPDFVKRPLLKEDQVPVSGYASIGGHTWVVKLVRRWALFPLRAGDLSVGPMTVGMLRPRAIAGSRRVSEALRIHVTEPPLAGRPPGYAVGDVGRFAVSAQVQPRQIEQGGAVGVHVEVSGRGNVPNTIAAPVREGVEWLTPEVHDEVGPIGQDAFGGKRSFDYVVRVQRSGDVDLGDISLPFWDPDQKRYDTAAAHLGVVKVTPAPAKAGPPPAEAERETLPGLPAPRDTLEGMAAARGHRTDSLALWIASIVLWPLSFGAALALRAAVRRGSAWWQQRRESPGRALEQRIAAAHAACSKADGRGADAAIARALEAATIAYTGVSVRGAVGGEVETRLQESGVAPEAARGVAELLRECEAARFSPDAVDTVAAQARWKRAQGAIRQLERR
jgi:hypothetical protein